MTKAKIMTAFSYDHNDKRSDEKITCEVIGEYGMVGSENSLGNVWKDKDGNLWMLWRFMRQYSFVPFEKKHGELDFWFREF